MIELSIKGDGSEIVALIQALQNGGLSSEPPLLSTPAEPEPDTATTAGPLYTDEQVQKGHSAFSSLISQWAVNFGADADPNQQPDRVALLEDSLRYFSDVMAFIHYSGGLTHAVRSVAPDHWTRQFCRSLAENLVSVSSATGVPGFSETLEYTQDYLDELNKLRKERK